MTDDYAELKQRLSEKTERLKHAVDPDDRYDLGGDVRELEKQVERTKGPEGDPPRYRRP